MPRVTMMGQYAETWLPDFKFSRSLPLELLQLQVFIFIYCWTKSKRHLSFVEFRILLGLNEQNCPYFEQQIHLGVSFFFFLKEFLYFYYLFIYLFTFGCVGSSFLCKGFL